MVLPHGQVFVGPLYGLLLLMFMGVLYLMGGTELQGFEITSYAPGGHFCVGIRVATCNVNDLSVIGDLLADLN